MKNTYSFYTQVDISDEVEVSLNYRDIEKIVSDFDDRDIDKLLSYLATRKKYIVETSVTNKLDEIKLELFLSHITKVNLNDLETFLTK